MRGLAMIQESPDRLYELGASEPSGGGCWCILTAELEVALHASDSVSPYEASEEPPPEYDFAGQVAKLVGQKDGSEPWR